MDLEKIERLLEIVARSGMAEVEVEEDDFRLVVRAAPAGAAAPPMMAAFAQPMPSYGGYPTLPPAPAPAASASMPSDAAAIEAPASAEASRSANDVVVQAPIVGTFYSAPSPDSAPFVAVGDAVKPGDVLCIIEAMKLMNEIQSEHAGIVRQILVQNAEPVEYDQPLFVIEPA